MTKPNDKLIEAAWIETCHANGFHKDVPILHRTFFIAGWNARDAVIDGVMQVEGLKQHLAAASERIVRLSEALIHIRDMPIYDQDDPYRVRHHAKLALEGK